MRRYETIFIVKPNVNEEQLSALLDRVSGIIGNTGGQILNVDKWGLRKLAYSIKKENQGHYVHLDYAAGAGAVAEMERIFNIDEQVLKFLTVKLQDKYIPGSEIEVPVSRPAQETEEEQSMEVNNG